jgi:hypothetical protein
VGIGRGPGDDDTLPCCRRLGARADLLGSGVAPGPGPVPVSYFGVLVVIWGFGILYFGIGDLGFGSWRSEN